MRHWLVVKGRGENKRNLRTTDVRQGIDQGVEIPFELILAAAKGFRHAVGEQNNGRFNRLQLFLEPFKSLRGRIEARPGTTQRGVRTPGQVAKNDLLPIQAGSEHRLDITLFLFAL